MKDSKRNQTRLNLISNIMLPAEKTNLWSKELDDNFKTSLQKDIDKNIYRYDCETIQEEADIISLILRETLEDENKTACLITTNRALARRVIQRCKFWNINLDDTAGTNLKDTPLGQYLINALAIYTNNFDSVTLLSFLKHHYTSIPNIDNYRQKIRNFEVQILRGKPIKNGFQGIKNRLNQKLNDPDNFNKPSEEIIEFINDLEKRAEGRAERILE